MVSACIAWEICKSLKVFSIPYKINERKYGYTYFFRFSLYNI